MTLYSELLVREKNNNPVRVGVIGAGQMGFGMVSQISTIPGMVVGGISDIKLENAQRAADAYNATASQKQDILCSTSFREVIHSDKTEVIVDATGVPEVGAQIMLETLIAKKHIVLLNVEVDITVGPFMKKLYDAAGLVYTGSDGDEPGATMQMYEFAKSMGMEVLVAGKGKNNAPEWHATPDTAKEKALRQHMNPHMLCAFQDGTKTMGEMNLLSNAIGYIPDVRGMHGVKADLDGTVEQLRLKEEGGVLSQYGVVEYVDGIAPGIFCIVKGQNAGVANELNYLMKKGERDRHILYRPYHLCSLETPLTCARAVIEHTYAIIPQGAPVSETVAFTKRDIKAGEPIDGIGGYSVRGVCVTHADQVKNDFVPIGLIGGKAVAKRDIKCDEFVTGDDIELDQDTTVYRLRMLQNAEFDK